MCHYANHELGQHTVIITMEVREAHFSLCSFFNPVNRKFSNAEKVVLKSSGLRAVFQLVGAASIEVRLLFEGVKYAKFCVCKSRKQSEKFLDLGTRT